MFDWLAQQHANHVAIGGVVVGVILTWIPSLVRNGYGRLLRRLCGGPKLKVSLRNSRIDIVGGPILVPSVYNVSVKNVGDQPTSVQSIKVREGSREQQVFGGPGKTLDTGGSETVRILEKPDYWNWGAGCCFFDIYASHRDKPYTVRIPKKA